MSMVMQGAFGKFGILATDTRSVVQRPNEPLLPLDFGGKLRPTPFGWATGTGCSPLMSLSLQVLASGRVRSLLPCRAIIPAVYERSRAGILAAYPGAEDGEVNQLTSTKIFALGVTGETVAAHAIGIDGSGPAFGGDTGPGIIVSWPIPSEDVQHDTPLTDAVVDELRDAVTGADTLPGLLAAIGAAFAWNAERTDRISGVVEIGLLSIDGGTAHRRWLREPAEWVATAPAEDVLGSFLHNVDADAVHAFDSHMLAGVKV